MSRYAKGVLLPIMQWDYGQQARGVSCEQTWFLPAFKELVERVEVLWIDELLNTPEKLQEAVLAKVEACSPDLIFSVPYRDEWSSLALKRLSERCPTLAWFGDDQWRFGAFSSKLAPSFSHVVTTDPFAKAKYRRIGVEALLSDWAGMVPASENLWLGDRSYEYDLSFVGGATESRRWAIKQLRKAGLSVECFGAGWDNGRVSFEEMDRIFARSRINLNLSNSVHDSLSYLCSSPKALASWLLAKKRAEQVKARNFEIPLAGGFQLTNYVFGLERHFDIGREIAIFGSISECAEMVRYYLDNEDERRALEEQGRLRAHRDHTYRERLAEILGQLWS